MKHIEWKCQLGWEKCEQCNYDSHPQLFTCTVCGASEGELTKECPGVPMTQEQKDHSYAGKLDFVDGNWKRS